MRYTTRLIDDPQQRPLLVGYIFDDAVQVKDPHGSGVLLIPRWHVTTPVLCCAVCGRAALLFTKKTGGMTRQYAECPHHAKHMYDALYRAQFDTQRYNRKERHQLQQQAAHWLGVWQRTFEKRAPIDASM